MYLTPQSERDLTPLFLKRRMSPPWHFTWNNSLIIKGMHSISKSQGIAGQSLGHCLVSSTFRGLKLLLVNERIHSGDYLSFFRYYIKKFQSKSIQNAFVFNRIMFLSILEMSKIVSLTDKVDEICDRLF